jgi:hypothetical protein
VDLEDGGIQSREQYVIDSGDESDNTDSSDSSSSDLSGERSSSREDTDESKCDVDASSGDERSSVNDTADTEKHRNFMKPSNKRHFKNLGLKMKRSSKGRHQRLPTNEEEAIQVEENRTPSGGKGRKGNPGEERRALVDASHRGTPSTATISKPYEKYVNKHLNPSTFPLEQCTDAEYGIRGTLPPATYSYASADPNNIDYEPQPLRKMEVLDTGNDLDKWHRRIVCIGLVTALTISLLIMIGSVIAYENRINVRPPPKNLLDICSMTNVGTGKGHQKCVKACQEAECCMASGAQSCFAEQEAVCTEVST